MKRWICLLSGMLISGGCNMLSDPVNDLQKIDSQPTVRGILLRSDGSTPAAGAVTTLRLRTEVAPVAAVTTDNTVNKKVALSAGNGYYSFDSLESGIYIIDAEDGSGNGVRIDSVIVIDPDTTVDIPPHSLKPQGTVTGKVLLDAGGDPQNVFILAFGSDRFVQAGAEGFFSMTDLPYGNYDLKIICLLDRYTSGKTVPVTVTPDSAVDLGIISLESQGLGTPQNVKLDYDSIRQNVKISWDPIVSPDLAGYNVYRTYQNSSTYLESPLNGAVVIDSCSFVDRTVLARKKYSYVVAAVAKDGTIGKRSIHQQVLTSVSYVIDTLDTIHSKTPMNVYWKDDTIPVVLYHQNRDIVIVEYDSEYHITHRTDIVLPFDVLLTAVMDNGNIYAIESGHPDSVEVYCFFPDGSLRFKCLIDCRMFSTFFDVHNDTLYFFEETRAGRLVNLTKAFDTTGKLLFVINDPDTSKEIIFFKHASDGNFYTTHWINPSTRWINGLEIRKHNFATGDKISYSFPTTMNMPALADAYKDVFIIQSLWSSTDAEIYNARGEILYDFGENPFGYITFGNARSMVAMNSLGRILMVKNGKVCLMTLPVDITAKRGNP